MKQKLKSILDNIVKLLYKSALGKHLIDQITTNAMQRKIDFVYNKSSFSFTIPNSLNLWRVNTFSTKEPETLEWIDNLIDGSVLWDIGANVGLYSIYAAKSKNCNVYSFEPSVFNLELLARNIFINDMSSKITIIPLPLTSNIEVSKLNMTSTAWGGAISTFGELAIGHDGKIMDKKFEFTTIGITIDTAVDLLKIQKPDYIKMDVDGIEHLILSGGTKTLKNVKGVIIEINDDFEEQEKTATILLKESGLTLKSKLHSEMVDKMTEFSRTYNQIWER
jgi:FkbM family methyltransferase